MNHGCRAYVAILLIHFDKKVGLFVFQGVGVGWLTSFQQGVYFVDLFSDFFFRYPNIQKKICFKYISKPHKYQSSLLWEGCVCYPNYGNEEY